MVEEVTLVVQQEATATEIDHIVHTLNNAHLHGSIAAVSSPAHAVVSREIQEMVFCQ